VSGAPTEDPCELRTTSTVRRALSETLPEPVAAAAYEFITGPLLADPCRIGKRLLPPMDDRLSARRGTYRVIYRIDDKDRVVTVVDVAHRQGPWIDGGQKTFWSGVPRALWRTPGNAG